MDRNGSELRKNVESKKSFIDHATPRMSNTDEYSLWIKLHIFPGRQTERRLRNACQQWYHRSGIIQNRSERGQWAVQSIFVSTKFMTVLPHAHVLSKNKQRVGNFGNVLINFRLLPLNYDFWCRKWMQWNRSWKRLVLDSGRGPAFERCKLKPFVLTPSSCL